MGFEKWLYRNGPGSPGHTARTLVKLYNNIHSVNQIQDDEEIYFAIYMERLRWQQKFGNNSCLLMPFLDKIGNIMNEKDMALFVFAIETLETKQFRFGITDRSIDVVLEVIREEVNKVDRSLIKLNYDVYRTKAIDFFNIAYKYAESMEY